MTTPSWSGRHGSPIRPTMRAPSSSDRWRLTHRSVVRAPCCATVTAISPVKMGTFGSRARCWTGTGSRWDLTLAAHATVPFLISVCFSADCGLTFALGWPGQWHAQFRGEGGSVVAQAGQADVRMYLLPGESVRTPRMTLMAWSGEEARAINLWRRWYSEHVMPRPGGQPASPLLQLASTDDGPGGEFTGATEQNQIEYQERFAREGVDYDVWWVDAGWYLCRDGAGDETHWCVTGTWAADPERFPRGLAPVSANASRHGAQLLLWFEPERVFPGTSLAENHPEWLLDRPGWAPDDRPPRPTTEPAHSFWLQDVSGLLDLSNPACQAALADMISGLIETYGIGIYREDFNYGPLEFWQAHDPADRRGATENLYVQGHLEFWDILLERHRGLLIDSCASGGRRNDLETMRRSVPLHFTDFGYGLHPVKLDFQQTMYEWLPYFKETTQSWDVADAEAQASSPEKQTASRSTVRWPRCSGRPLTLAGLMSTTWTKPAK